MDINLIGLFKAINDCTNILQDIKPLRKVR